MKRLAFASLLAFVLLGASASAFSAVGGFYISGGSRWATPSAACAAQFGWWNDGTGVFNPKATYGYCTNGNSWYAVLREDFTCSGDVTYDVSSSVLSCASSCEAIGKKEVNLYLSDGTTLVGSICIPSDASCANLKYTLQAWQCFGTSCPTGTVDGSMSYTGTSLPATICVGGCVYTTGGVSVGAKIDGVMKWATGGTSTGASCTGDTGSAEPVDVGQDLDGCVTDGQGRKVCPSATPDCINVDGNEVCDVNGKQCEVVNGKISCAGGEPMDPDTVVCWQENGQTVCAGSKGQATSETQTTVNPDGTTTKTTTTTSNVKGTGTKTTTTTYDANGNPISSSTSLTGGSDPGSSGTGGGGGGQDGEVGGADGENTDEEESFAGSDLGDGAALDLTGKDKTAAKAKLDAAWSSVQAAPIVAALGVNPGSVPVGACPTLSMTLPLGIGNVSTDIHCTTWEAVKGLLSVVSMAVWAILGVVIIASA